MDRLLVSKKLVVPISRYSTYAYNNGTCNLYNSSNALTRSAEVTRLAVRTLDALAMKKQPLVSIFQEARDDETIIESLGERLDSDEPLERDDGTHKNDITELPLVRRLQIANPFEFSRGERWRISALRHSAAHTAPAARRLA